MRRVWLTLLMVLTGAAQAVAQDRIVLVADASSPLESLSSFEVRKIYLGIEVAKQGRFVRALRNASSPMIETIFLQTVVGLTESRYERRLIENLVRFGTIRPAEYSGEQALREALRNDPFAVSYVLVHDDRDLEGLKVLRILWQEF